MKHTTLSSDPSQLSGLKTIELNSINNCLDEECGGLSRIRTGDLRRVRALFARRPGVARSPHNH
jgi:hypothetical protein